MQRLYNFFLGLFVLLFLISVIFGTLILCASQHLIYSDNTSQSSAFPGFVTFIKPGLWYGFIYAITLFLIIILLVKKSIESETKFTIKKTLFTVIIFYLLTGLIFFGYSIWASRQINNEKLIFSLFDKGSFLPAPLWLPFLIAWAVLFLILHSQIKKTK